ncbi:MAG: hypothetical protein J7M21_01590, partial [Planctomycetes bacterium]|nr:hypothetical protein [Planctomycetota bacterium]
TDKMRVLITAGPTREYIDSVRFISNASSGRMGRALAAAAVEAGHDVTLLLGPVDVAPPAGCRCVRFVSVEELRAALDEWFARCDVLYMAAAVGDFRPADRPTGKIPRSAGPVTVRLVPTEDVLGRLAGLKAPHQKVVAFAVEDPPRRAAEDKARAELAAKGADFVVVNMPQAMGAADSEACVLAPGGVVLPWAVRSKDELARRIIELTAPAATSPGQRRPGR